MNKELLRAMALALFTLFFCLETKSQSRNAAPYCYPHAISMSTGTCTGSNSSNPRGYGFNFNYIRLNTFYQQSSCYGSSDSDAYRNWNLSTDLMQGKDYQMEMQTPYNTIGYNVSCGFWIDYNQNNLFEASEMIASNYYNNKTIGGYRSVFAFKVPCSAQTGSTRIRVRVQMGTKITGADTCNKMLNAYSETWDFKVNIISAPAPLADFTYPSTIYVKNKVLLTCKDSWSSNYSWDLNNDATFEQNGVNRTITVGQFMWTSAGTKCVRLIVQNCTGKDSILKCIQVIAPTAVPQPDFKANYRIIPLYETVKIRDLSTQGPWSWRWDVYDSVTYANKGVLPCIGSGDVLPDPFNKGYDEFSSEPEFQFFLPGCYTVRMWANNDVGKSSEKVKTCYIRVLDPRDTTKGISGRVFQDLDTNCSYSSTDSLVNNISFFVNDSSGQRISKFFSSNGKYNIGLDSGSYVLVLDTLNKVYQSQCPYPGIDTAITLSYSKPLANRVDFSIKCKEGFDVQVTGLNVRGRVFPSLKHAICPFVFEQGARNGLMCKKGISGTVRIEVNGPVRYYGKTSGARNPSGISGKVFTYNISNFESIRPSGEFGLEFTVDTTANIDDTIFVKVDITTINGDLDTVNNHFEGLYKVRNSYDPNYKETSPEFPELPFKNWIYYTVHFQNTGNESAINIKILDTLDAKLDAESFEVLDYSHPMQADIKGRSVKFSFPNIELPDSFSNEPASHGYVYYRVRPAAYYNAGTQIKNTAYIYFDYNKAIVTNTSLNTYVDKITGTNAPEKPSSLQIFPNPGTGVFNVKSLNTYEGISELCVYDVYGNLLFRQMVASEFLIDLSTYASGVYIVKLKSGNAESSALLLKN